MRSSCSESLRLRSTNSLCSLRNPANCTVMYAPYASTARIVTTSPRYKPRAGPNRVAGFFSTSARIYRPATSNQLVALGQCFLHEHSTQLIQLTGFRATISILKSCFCWSNMLTLNLSARPSVKLPASDFPRRADIYVCDQCGRDITKYFRPRLSHTSAPIGPERYKCLCGRKYLTGATEWDHLGDWERSKRGGDAIGIGILLSAISSVLGFLLYLALHFASGVGNAAVVAALVIGSLPFVLVQIGFWPRVLASMLRTRCGTND